MDRGGKGDYTSRAKTGGRMKRMMLCVVAAGIVSGCGGISKQDLDNLETKLDSKIAQTAAEMDRKVNATDAKYANMLAIEQQVKNGVEQIATNKKLLEGANATMIQILTAQRNALKEQLKSVEDQLDALKK
jgi:hypothetical protein